jgi:3-hydroxyisobutyrate dehydrogenase-like beta-hydroxyacid dehydrogenase
MSSSQHFSVGAIGAGTLAQAIAGHAVAAGHRVIFSNSPRRRAAWAPGTVSLPVVSAGWWR